jgi:hypothetical protein
MEMKDTFRELILECPEYEALTVLGSDFDLILFFAPAISVLFFTRYASKAVLRSNSATEGANTTDEPGSKPVVYSCILCLERER